MLLAHHSNRAAQQGCVYHLERSGMGGIEADCPRHRTGPRAALEHFSSLIG